jgi:hypothetical protein
VGGTADRAAQILARSARKPGGVRQTYREADGKMVVSTYQDVEPHLKYAADMRRAERESIGRFGRTGTFHQTMSPPNNVILKIAAKLGIPAGRIFDREHMRRIGKELKSPEYAAFRTTERRI